MYSCGTLRSNRKGFPSDLKPYLKKGLNERGESKVRQHENITVSLWQDNRPVVVISTNSDPTETTTVQRKVRDGTTSRVSCPQSIYRKRPGRPSMVPSAQRFCEDHFPKRGADKPRRCHYCQHQKKQRHETVWHCSSCQVFLCHNGREDDCFLQYHRRLHRNTSI